MLEKIAYFKPKTYRNGYAFKDELVLKRKIKKTSPWLVESELKIRKLQIISNILFYKLILNVCFGFTLSLVS